MISFAQVPTALRYPGAYIEVDGSQAGLGGDIPAVLLVGQKLPAGTAAAGEIVQVSGVQDAIAKAGAGSMLAQMAARYRAVDPVLDLYILPYADNAAGVQATGTITVNTVPTVAGTLSLYIAGKLVSVAMVTGQTPTQIATAIAAAINAAGTDIPVTATSAAAVVTLTARHKGTCGNAIDLRLNFFKEAAVVGLGLTIAAMAGGSGDPAPGNLTAILGQFWYRYIGLGINDAATLAAWHAESQLHYKPPVQQGFRIFTTHRGDYAAAAAFGTGCNYEHICDLSLEINPPSTWEAAATLVAAAAPKLYNSPAESLEGVPLPGLMAKTYHDWTNGNSLLFKGMSVMQVGKDGTCSIKRLVSMFQFRPDGASDDAFLDINVAELMERIRIEQRFGARRFVGTAAAKSNEGYRPGLRITTEDDVRAMLLSVYKHTLMEEYGWVQAYDYYKDTLAVQQDPTNPSRFNYRDTPILLSPYYVLAGRSVFYKAVPTY
jgi:phage tail sheath gpL-like